MIFVTEFLHVSQRLQNIHQGFYGYHSLKLPLTELIFSLLRPVAHPAPTKSLDVILTTLLLSLLPAEPLHLISNLVYSAVWVLYHLSSLARFSQGCRLGSASHPISPNLLQGSPSCFPGRPISHGPHAQAHWSHRYRPSLILHFGRVGPFSGL